MPVRFLVAVTLTAIIVPSVVAAGEGSIGYVSAETAPQPKHSVFRLRAGESTVVTGRVLRVEEGEAECWCLLWDDGGLFELADLPESLKRDGLRIRATVHVEDESTGICAPGRVLHVDDVAAE
jgi:hypothetical protein